MEEVSRNPGFAALLADFNAKAGALSEEESVNDGPEPETAAPASPLSPAASPRSPGKRSLLLISPSFPLLNVVWASKKMQGRER